MRINKLFMVVAGAVLSIANISCSLGVGSNQTVTVNSNVPAKIIANGTPVGTTPISFEAKRAKSLALIATAPGYSQSVKTVDRQFSQTGMLDAVGGLFLIVPWIGLVTDGAWELQENNVFLNLEKK
jgi:hypothetical protein